MNIHVFAITFFLVIAVGRGSAATVFEYDVLGRLTTSMRSDDLKTVYTYDLTGNRTRKVVSKVNDSSRGDLAIASGLYQGLAQSVGDTLGDSLLKLSVGTGSSFSGTLNFHGAIYQLKGAFVAGEGGVFVWNGSIHRSGLPDLIVSLRFDPSDPSGAITGTLSDDTDSATIALSRAGFDAKHPTALAGKYTVLLPANPDFPGDPYPQGDGYALLSVTAAGSVRLTGKLGDGSVITQSAPLSADGRFAVHLPLYKKRGVLAGWIDFQPVNEVSDFNGTLHWTKSDTAGGPLYATGFDLEVDLMGSRFVPPVAGHRILNLENSAENGVIFLGEGNLDQALNFPATLQASNVVQSAVTTPKAFVLTMTPSTGFFSGSFFHPVTKKTAVFSGVVFQKQNLATGFFPGLDKAGYVSLHRTATSALLLPPAGVITPSNEITHPPAFTLLQDDFDDGSFDASKWFVADNGDSRVAEESGVMKVETTITDKAGTLQTKVLTVPMDRPWTLTRRVLLHRDTPYSYQGGNKFFTGYMRFFIDQVQPFSVSYCDYDYSGDSPNSLPKHGFVLTRNGAGGTANPNTGNVTAELAALILDQWFNERVTYDPYTGLLRYYVNGNLLSEFDVGKPPDSSPRSMYIEFQAYAWWTTHWQHFDDFVLKSGE